MHDSDSAAGKQGIWIMNELYRSSTLSDLCQQVVWAYICKVRSPVHKRMALGPAFIDGNIVLLVRNALH